MRPTAEHAIPIRVDNTVTLPNGTLLVECMFSGIVDLSTQSSNLAARLHPAKARAFEWIIAGTQSSVTTTESSECTGAPSAREEVAIIPDVQFHVNGPTGIVVRHFSEIRANCKQLSEHGSCVDVRTTTTLAGFEPDAEPIVREMCDGSLLLVFSCMPPLITETDPKKAKRFNFHSFSADLAAALDVAVIQDDREVFAIQRPKADTLERLRRFLATYWSPPRKSWLKFW